MPIVSKLPTYRVEICFGLAPGYKPSSVEVLRRQGWTASALCRRYCDDHKVGLTITETHFMYPGGSEPGMVVSLINYPRFPILNSEVLQAALELADLILIALDQERLTVVEIPGETFLVERHKPA
jgi:hypothetical protein